MEAEVWQEARKVMAEDRPKTIHLDLTGKEAEEGGMVCGGVMDIYIEPITPPPRVFIFGGVHLRFCIQDEHPGWLSSRRGG